MHYTISLIILTNTSIIDISTKIVEPQTCNNIFKHWFVYNNAIYVLWHKQWVNINEKQESCGFLRNVFSTCLQSQLNDFITWHNIINKHFDAEIAKLWKIVSWMTTELKFHRLDLNYLFEYWDHRSICYLQFVCIGNQDT